MLLVIGLILFIFILGAGTGVVFQAQKNAPRLKNADKNIAVIKSLSSKAVPSIVAYGQVAKVDGKNVTISYMSDSVTVHIADSAQVYSFAKTGAKGTSSTQQNANFTDIKKGDTVSINLKLLADGTLEGSTVNILIPFGSANNTAK